MELKSIQSLYLDFLSKNNFSGKPDSLYDAMNYSISIGGKRIRPLLVLSTVNVLRGNVKNALNAAHAIEIFHNFTLAHDDIMDKSEVRRGSKTLHIKTNESTAILAGDALVIESYKFLLKYPADKIYSILNLFTKTAMEVCEGQQMDMEFETKNKIHSEEYLEMIKLKTSVLLGASTQLGAILADADKNIQKKFYNIGLNLGLAFQMKDDYLDTFGDDRFGKKIGGDIVNNKKTFLHIHCLEHATKKQLTYMKSLQDKNDSEKIAGFQNLYRETGADIALEKMMDSYSKKTMKTYNSLNLIEKNPLLELMNQLFDRKI